MPHSRDSLVLLPGVGRRTLEPPADLGEIEAVIFRQVVASVAHEHFTAEDLGLLCAYCRALALERRASDELAAAAVGSLQAWLPVYSAAVRAVSTLSVRLRLGPKSRHPNKVRRPGKMPPSRPSYYDLHPAVPASSKERPPSW
jgi:phage terminase small subunit